METSEEIITGTCLTMCPEKEMMLREREKLLHPFEFSMRGVEKLSLADHSKMVKEFSRPAAGRADIEPDCLRPAPVLKQTVEYMYTSIVPKSHPAWTVVYEFVFDRLRAVRQDMVMQGINGPDAINLLEQVVRFHLYAAYRLRDANLSEYDPVINKQHLLECLKRLLYLYQVTPGYHTNRVEMESVYLLDNLGDVHALTHYLDLDKDLRKSPLLFLCYSISIAFVQGNYLRVLRLIWKLPCTMCLCAVSRHLFQIRINFLEILASGFSVKNCKFPVHHLTKILHTESEKATLDLCFKCGLIDMFDNSSLDYVCFNKSSFLKPNELKIMSQLCPLERLLSKIDLPKLLLGFQNSESVSSISVNPDTSVQKKDVTELAENVHLMTLKDLSRTQDIRLTNVQDNISIKPSIGRGRGRGRTCKPSNS